MLCREIVVGTISGVISGIVVLLIGNSLLHGQKRSEFRSYIESLRKNIAVLNATDFIHEVGRWRDITNFDDSVLQVSTHIKSGRFAQFKLSCAAYRGIQFTGHDTQAQAEATKSKLISVLDELLKCAK